MRFAILLVALLLLMMGGAEGKYSPALEVAGNVSMNTYGSTNYITGLPNPSMPTDAAPWKSVNAVNTSLNTKINKSDAPTNVRDYGAVGDGTADDTASIQAAITASADGSTIYFPSGVYKITAPLLIGGSWKTLLGNGIVIIRKTTNTVGSSASRGFYGATDSYVVDAIISVDHATNDYYYGLVIKNLYLESTATNPCTYAIFGPRQTQINFENIITERCNYGVFTYNTWMARITDFTAHHCISIIKYASDGVGTNAGTSLTATRCWADSTTGSATYAYDLWGLSYSSLIGCGADNLYPTGVGGAYRFSVSTGISLISCATESMQGEVLRLINSRVTAIDFKTYNISGATSGTTAAIWIQDSILIAENCLFTNLVTPRSQINFREMGASSATWVNSDFPYTAGIQITETSIISFEDNDGKRYMDADYQQGLRSLGHWITWGTAAPTSGTHARGDIQFRSDATSGATPGWVCTTAGTPGTWRAMANLASS